MYYFTYKTRASRDAFFGEKLEFVQCFGTMLFPRPAVPEMRGVLVAVGIPGAFVLGARLLMTIVFQSDSRNADYLLKGIVQGVLVYHAILSSYNSIALALFLGISGRLAGDFVRQRDHWKLASTLLGVAFGILMADVVSHLTEDSSWTSIEIVDDTWDERSRRRHAPRRRISEPRRIEELPSVYEELSSIDSRSWAEETEGRTDVEMEVSKLRAKALHAAGQRRRFREERKWAWSQGNFARAFQLRWQVKKYDALAGSFTREADAKLIEGTHPLLLRFERLGFIRTSE